MKISEGGRGRVGVLLKEWTTRVQLIQGFSDRTNKVPDAHFLVSVVELTPFLSISVCWFWFRLSQTRKRSPEEMGLLV